MADILRPPTPAGGWGRPWPDVAELAAAVPASSATLIGEQAALDLLCG